MTVTAQLKKLLMFLHEIGPASRLKFIMALDEGLRCHYCRCILQFRDINKKDFATKDHIIPKSKGGTADPDNIVIACQGCNQARATMPYEQFKGKVKVRA